MSKRKLTPKQRAQLVAKLRTLVAQDDKKRASRKRAKAKRTARGRFK